MNLSKREKNLLYVLLLVVVYGFGVQFFIQPAMEERKLLQGQIDTAAAQKRMMELSIADIPNIKANITEEQKKVQDAQAYIPYLEKDYETDRKIITFARSVGLSITAQENVNAVSVSYPEVGVAQIEFSANGSLAAGTAFMDLVNSHTNMAVVSYGIGKNEKNEEEAYTVEVNYNHTYTILSFYDMTEEGAYCFEE